MKKTILILWALWACNTLSALEIKVISQGLKTDSLFLYAYTEHYRWEKILSRPFEEKTLFKSRQDLAPGMYLIASDSSYIAFLVLSGPESQKFDILYEEGVTTYVGSLENSINQEYLEQIGDFERQKQTFNDQYMAVMQSGEEYAVLEKQVKWLAEEAAKVEENKRNYQLKMAEETRGMLLSAVIRGSIEVPKPAEEILNDRGLFEDYLLSHHFDYFPWEDPRIVHTPVAVQKFKNYAYLLNHVSPLKAMLYLESTLDSIRTYPDSYYPFCDYMLHVFGGESSAFSSQEISLLLLRDMLTMEGLPKERRERCEQEIARLDRNNPGDIAPDFPLVLSTGDTTTLHAIPAEYLLLVLQNPDCQACQETQARLAEMDALKKAVAEGHLQVLVLYFEQNEALWRSYVDQSTTPDFLQGWDYQLDIERKNLYDTQAIPFLYILNNEKRIVKKDIRMDELDDFFRTLKVY